MFTWLHTFRPEPILLSVGPVSVHWYGLLLAIGAAAGIALAARLASRGGIRRESVYDLALLLIVGCIIASRLYYVVYAWGYYREHLAEVFQLWKGGLAIHGTLIAGPLIAWWWSRRHDISFPRLLDALAPGLVLGQAIGRWGNYFNQELFGTPTALPWGIPIDPARRPAAFADAAYFHPTFLYESLWDLCVLAILLALHRRRGKNKKTPHEGSIALVYLLLYSLGRIGTELLRTDYTPYVLGMRWALLVSIALAFVSGCALALREARPDRDTGSAGGDR